MNYFIISIVSFIVLVAAGQLVLLNKIKQNNMSSSNLSKINEISNTILNAALVYLKSQLSILALIILFITGVLYCVSYELSFWFFVGACVSWIAGFISMYVSVSFNKKVAIFSYNFNQAFQIAFIVGQIIAFLSVGLVLSVMYACCLLSASNALMYNFIGLSFGASLISVFARVGGGIFTKAADMAADICGKNKHGLSEDDPRNPAVIADALGDNIGDAFGMTADLMESYVVITAAAITIFLGHYTSALSIDYIFNILILGTIVSFITLITGWTFDEKNKFSSLNISVKMFSIYAVILGFLAYYYPISNLMILNMLLGVFFASILMPITEYFTSANFSPVQKIVNASSKGGASNILQGLIVGYQAVYVKSILLIVHISLSYLICDGGLLGLMVSCLSMISVSPVILALDGFGPITDNAGGLVEMSKLDKSYRAATDKLDIIGNKNKATTKGYAIYISAISAYILGRMYQIDIAKYIEVIPMYNIAVMIGLFAGIFIISYFVANCLAAVNDASMVVIEEIDAQFKEMNRTKVQPNYQKVIAILTKASLKGMILPTLMPIFVIITLFTIIKYALSYEYSLLYLAGVILSITITGIMLSINMTVAGGAWDNAKKAIETNDEKGTEKHKAAVIGDVVGDPFKDTAGPAINPIIKMLSLLCIMIVMATR